MLPKFTDAKRNGVTAMPHMKKAIWLLPLVAILAQVRTPAGWQLLPHWGIIHESPFRLLVMLLVLTFMAGTVLLDRERDTE